MIAPAVVESVLESHDFDVHCVDCEADADVAVKGCSDQEHELFVREALQQVVPALGQIHNHNA